MIEFLKSILIKVAVWGGFTALIFLAVYVYLTAIGGQGRCIK